MRRLWPRTLRGQMLLLLLLAIAGAQLASLVIFADERRLALLAARREQVTERTAALVRLLRETPKELHDRLVRAASSSRLRFRISSRSLLDPRDRELQINPVARRLRRMLAPEDARLVLADTAETTRLALWRERLWHWFPNDHLERWKDGEEPPSMSEMMAQMGRMGRMGMMDGMAMMPPARPPLEGAGRRLLLSVALAPDRWLNVETLVPAPVFAWLAPSLVASVLAAAAISVVILLLLRRLTRPLKSLAQAADAFGRGMEVERLEERGPEEIHHTVRAFNLMRERLRRFVEDRTRMLAAIGHDLRTPITALRIRAEFVEDDENRAKIIATLDEMQRMIEAALAFLREEAAVEVPRRVDLAALVESLSEDCSDLGWQVETDIRARPVVTCRADSLRRALRNLVENAVRYGKRARLILESERNAVRILVEDEGPGIPEERLQKVFEPFFRLERSRSRETGGIGLGLAIARTIARSHGGDLRLENRRQGGLRAVLTLPL